MPTGKTLYTDRTDGARDGDWGLGLGIGDWGIAAGFEGSWRGRGIDAHEQALWTEFAAAMHGGDTSKWLYEGDRAKDRPADMGFYIGYKICQAYYRRATDQPEAVRRLLEMSDPDALLKESGYGARFAAPEKH